MSLETPRVMAFSHSLQQLAARFLWVPALLLHLPWFLLDLIEFKGDVRFLKCALRITNTYSPSLIRVLSSILTFNTHTPYFSDFETSKQALYSIHYDDSLDMCWRKHL